MDCFGLGAGAPYILRSRLVPGARIELATPASSGLRSTTELPRPDTRRKNIGCEGQGTVELAYEMEPFQAEFIPHLYGAGLYH